MTNQDKLSLILMAIKIQLTNQMTINGQVFYQIANTNHWVNANDLTLKAKTSKKNKKAKKTSVSYRYPIYERDSG